MHKSTFDNFDFECCSLFRDDPTDTINEQTYEHYNLELNHKSESSNSLENTAFDFD